MSENRLEPLQNDWRRVLKKLPWLLLIPLGLLTPGLLAGHTAWAEETYAAQIYPAVKNVISAVTGLVPVSVAECVLYALCIGIPLLLVKQIVRAAIRHIPWSAVVSTVLSVAIAGGVLLNLFYPTWGCCYFRKPLSERMGLTTAGDRPAEELAALTMQLADAAAEVRAHVPEDEAGVFAVSAERRKALFASIPSAYAALAADKPVFAGNVTPAKAVEWSEGLSWLGIAGIYVGFTEEANVNVHQPALLAYQSAAHETAHQLGLASENEAEFCGILACLHSDEPEIVYSGLMEALIRCGNALHDADAALFSMARAHYSDAMVRDLAAYNAFWARYDGPAADVADTVNDNYLKHNAVESGVKSYGESVDLLLAMQETENILGNMKKF